MINAGLRQDARAVAREPHGQLSQMRREHQQRVRNVLALIRSVFSRTIAAGGSLEEVAAHFDGRLDVIGRYQQTAVLADDGVVDLELLVRDELLKYAAATDGRVRLAGPEVALSTDVAQLVGLAIHELMTNAVKFGALSHRGDRAAVRIEWRADGDGVRLDWTECGVPVVAATPLRRGFGLTFIEQVLPDQLGGDAAVTLRPGGLACTIRFRPASAQACGAF